MRQLEHLGIPTITKRNALYLVYAGDSIPPVLGVPGDPVSEESALCRNRKLSRSDPGFAKEGPRGFASQHKKKYMLTRPPCKRNWTGQIGLF